MAISTKLNASYRPASPLVTEKYRPLLDIGMSAEDAEAIRAAAQNRMTAFANYGVQPGLLTFLVNRSIDQLAELEAGKQPPLVAISSNRAGWLKQGYDTAQQILTSLGVGHFTSVLDGRALAKGPVPFYLPIRLGATEAAQRNVYLFVESDEFGLYQRLLDGTGITIVGWRTEGPERLAGFGASRYVVMEFFKYIYRQNQACAKLWMLDDNVSYIRSFPGFGVAEAALKDAFGLGFRGGVQAHANAAFVELSKKTDTPIAAAPTEAPILQQAVLWNVAKFEADGYSFSPYFILSAEDTSLTEFLTKIIPSASPSLCLYYKGCEVFKGLPTYDNTLASRLMQASRQRLLTYCWQQHNDVACTSPDVETAQTLAKVVEGGRTRYTTVADTETVEQTYSKALEQLLFTAMAQKIRLPAGVFALARPQITSKLTRL